MDPSIICTTLIEKCCFCCSKLISLSCKSLCKIFTGKKTQPQAYDPQSNSSSLPNDQAVPQVKFEINAADGEETDPNDQSKKDISNLEPAQEIATYNSAGNDSSSDSDEEKQAQMAIKN